MGLDSEQTKNSLGVEAGKGSLTKREAGSSLWALEPRTYRESWGPSGVHGPLWYLQ